MDARQTQSQLRRDKARALRAAGDSVAAIARRLGVTERTVKDYLAGSTWRVSKREARSTEILVEAGLAYLVGFGVAPSARNWNATFARRDSTETFVRHRLGWIAEADADDPIPTIRKWPSPGAVARTFGSFEAFLQEVQRERVRRAQNSAPYSPVPLPDEHVALVNVDAVCRDTGGPEWVRSTFETFGHGSPELRPTIESLAPGERPSVIELNGAGLRIAPLRGRGGLAVVGAHGVGRTSFLSSVALSDVTENIGEVIVIERSPTIGGVLLNAGVRLCDPRFRETPKVEHDGLASVHWIADANRQVRTTAIRSFAPAVAKADRGLTSLIVDDADAILEPLCELATSRLPGLVIQVAWCPTGATIDRQLLNLLPSLTLFRVDSYAAAEMLADHFNRLNDEVYHRLNHGQSGDLAD